MLEETLLWQSMIQMNIPGSSSMTVGLTNTIGGNSSIAIGTENTVNAASSMAVGRANTIDAVAAYSTALGRNNTINSRFSHTIGNDNVVATSADGAFAIGQGNTVNARGMALGRNAVSNQDELALGFANGIKLMNNTLDEGNAATMEKLVVQGPDNILYYINSNDLTTSSPLTTQTGNYNVTATDTVLVDASGNTTVRLPTPVLGKKLVIKKIDTTTNNVVIDGNGATIDGAATRTTAVAYQTFVVQSDGTNWFIIN